MTIRFSRLTSVISQTSLILGVMALASAASAQTIVRYGEPAHSGSITAANQSIRYLLLGAQKGDVLRITFCSQYSGYPSYAYHHRLDVSDGTAAVGKGIDGRGALTVTLGATAPLTISVQARDKVRLGWYAFKVDRINSPVQADRIAFDWNMKGAVSSTASFAAYTIHATTGGTAQLSFTSKYVGYPRYTHVHYAELLDDTGARVAVVSGNGTTSITLKASGVYTLFVAARNFQDTGSYAVSIKCQSWPSTPCDCNPHTSSYGAGWPGTNGVPLLTTSTPPKLGSTLTIDIGNSSGTVTPALVLIGTDRASLKSAALGGTLLVGAPTVLPPMMLQPGGGTLALPIPNNPLLCGLGFSMQAVVADSGALPGNLAFSRGMLLVIGR